MKALQDLFQDPEVTEILLNSPQHIWYEKQGQLYALDFQFQSKLEYKNYFESLLFETHGSLNQDQPFHDSKFGNFRLSLVDESITRGYSQAAFRRQSIEVLTLQELVQSQWCNSHEASVLKEIIHKKDNFLIVGNTGSGKTTIANALLQHVGSQERVVVIEDSDEIQLPNSASTKLLTKISLLESKQDVNQSLLLKQALRLRPDRLVVGEIRFTEAKDFLLCLSTGHKGGFGTLHALHPRQALLRLEMLIQMGAPQWSLSSIRQLIHLSLNKIIILERNSMGRRRLKSIHQLTSLEDTGFLLEQL